MRISLIITATNHPYLLHTFLVHLLWARFLFVLSCAYPHHHCNEPSIYSHGKNYIHTCNQYTTNTTHANNIQPVGNTNRGFFRLVFEE
ncbi:hypothetical protein B0H14DRAFT_2993663 [Mycena olivaceomarginata]|nr:hypothetical protein B0H14DRAFT_2993663 [Mycena olivaceomarginata]